jgi:hypothetical protein
VTDVDVNPDTIVPLRVVDFPEALGDLFGKVIRQVTEVSEEPITAAVLITGLFGGHHAFTIAPDGTAPHTIIVSDDLTPIEQLQAVLGQLVDHFIDLGDWRRAEHGVRR